MEVDSQHRRVGDGVLQGPAGLGLHVRAAGPEEHLAHAHSQRQPAVEAEQGAEELEDRDHPRRARQEVPGVQLDAKVCTGASFPLAAGERADGGVHRGQVLPGQVQDEAEVPPPAVPAGGTGAQAHLPAAGGLQHCARTEVHQEVDRHADVHHD